jgi:hypothetical protein
MAPKRWIYPRIRVVACVFDHKWCQLWGVDEPGSTGIAPWMRFEAEGTGPSGVVGGIAESFRDGVDADDGYDGWISVFLNERIEEAKSSQIG